LRPMESLRISADEVESLFNRATSLSLSHKIDRTLQRSVVAFAINVESFIWPGFYGHDSFPFQVPPISIETVN
jgi:hypothetical protein